MYMYHFQYNVVSPSGVPPAQVQMKCCLCWWCWCWCWCCCCCRCCACQRLVVVVAVVELVLLLFVVGCCWYCCVGFRVVMFVSVWGWSAKRLKIVLSLRLRQLIAPILSKCFPDVVSKWFQIVLGTLILYWATFVSSLAIWCQVIISLFVRNVVWSSNFATNHGWHHQSWYHRPVSRWSCC